MKRFITILITLTLVFTTVFLSGCSSKTPEETSEQTSETTRYSADLMELVSAPEGDYTLAEETYEKEEVSIAYPVLQGDNMEDVNLAISSFAEEIADFYLADWPSLVMPIVNQVTLHNKEFISIVFTGEGNFEGAAHPFSVFLTLNIRLADAKKISLIDYQVLDQDYLTLVLEHPKPGTDPQTVEGTIDFVKQEQQDGNLGTMDALGDMVFSYFTPEAVGLSLPTIHALGDHMEFEVPYTA